MIISDSPSKTELRAAYQAACNTMHVLRIVLSQSEDAHALELARGLFSHALIVERIGPLSCTLRWAATNSQPNIRRVELALDPTRFMPSTVSVPASNFNDASAGDDV